MNGARRYYSAFILLLCGIFASVILTGCVKHTEGYQSAKLSSYIPVNNGSAKTPVIIIHGLFGAELFSPGGEKVWGKFSNKRITDKKILIQLASPELKVGSILIHSEITPANIPVYRFKNYVLLLNALKKFGYSKHDILIFAYDWRKSVPENAAELHKFIKTQEKIFPASQKFNIIAHSMGGLITRYYLQYGNNQLPAKGIPPLSDAGSKKISKVFIFGTPNCGYADTLLELCNGLAFVRGAAKYPQELLIRFPSYFCMLPSPELKTFIYSDNKSAVDFFNIRTWQNLKWLPDDKPSTFHIVAENLDIAKRFNRAMDNPMKRNKNIKLYLFAGNAFDTVRQCKVNRKTGSISITKYAPGDGKILFESAISNKLIPWDGIYLFGAAHMGLFASDDAMRNLAYLLETED